MLFQIARLFKALGFNKLTIARISRHSLFMAFNVIMQ